MIYKILGAFVPEPDVEVLSGDPCSVELDFSSYNDAAVQVFTIACNEIRGGDIMTLRMEKSSGTCVGLRLRDLVSPWFTITKSL
jgi:hypothetical protein